MPSTHQFMFQQSLIWDAYNAPDPNGDVRIVKANSESRARKQLPDAGMGRSWVLVSSEARK